MSPKYKYATIKLYALLGQHILASHPPPLSLFPSLSLSLHLPPSVSTSPYSSLPLTLSLPFSPSLLHRSVWLSVRRSHSILFNIMGKGTCIPATLAPRPQHLPSKGAPTDSSEPPPALPLLPTAMREARGNYWGLERFTVRRCDVARRTMFRGQRGGVTILLEGKGSGEGGRRVREMN